jgi:hypothetical protein
MIPSKHYNSVRDKEGAIMESPGEEKEKWREG